MPGQIVFSITQRMKDTKKSRRFLNYCRIKQLHHLDGVNWGNIQIDNNYGSTSVFHLRAPVAQESMNLLLNLCLTPPAHHTQVFYGRISTLRMNRCVPMVVW